MTSRRHLPHDLGAAALTLAWGGFAHQVLPARYRSTAGLGAALGLAALARRQGADWREIGCDRRDLPAGLKLGAIAAGTIAAVTAAARALDRSGSAFQDARISEASPAEAAVQLLLRIPLATALAEELVFRGVILGLGVRGEDRRRALLVSSLAFGLWHIGSALHPARQTATAGFVGEHRAPVPAVVLGDVAATTIGGLGFGWLRLRSGSIAAPVMAHAALNGSAYLATRLSKDLRRANGAPRSRGGALRRSLRRDAAR
jgi:membrane protease YdiL (CAAX protease family)